MSLFERIKALMTSRSTQPCKPAKGTLVVVLTRSDTGIVSQVISALMR